MERIKNLRAASLLGCLLLLLATACADQRESITLPTPTNPPAPTAEPTRDPIAPTQTAQALQPKYIVERVTLATNVSAGGEPREEVTMIPVSTRNIYLSVLTSSIDPPATFRAYWYEGDTILAQSEQLVTTVTDDERWISLGFQAQTNFDPSKPHKVELRINDTFINSFSFRVGAGNLSDVIAEAKLAVGIDDDGDPIGEGDEFSSRDAQIVTIARVSNKVDPKNMIFSALLKKGDEVIQQRGPDGGQPAPQATPTPEDRLLTFTFVPKSELALGEYTVQILLNGVPVRDLGLEVVDAPAATPTPLPTPTSVQVSVDLVNLLVAEEVDEDTNEPIDGRVSYWIGEPNQRKEFFVAVRLRDLTEDDVVEVEQTLDGEHVNTLRYPATDLDDGWLAVPVNIWMPPEGGATKEYRFIISINGEQLDAETLTVDSR